MLTSQIDLTQLRLTKDIYRNFSDEKSIAAKTSFIYHDY